MARRYEFYFRLAKQFYERAQRVSKILFLPRENKIHIFKLLCNIWHDICSKYQYSWEEILQLIDVLVHLQCIV